MDLQFAWISYDDIVDEFTKDNILAALAELAVELALAGERHEIVIAGGAAVVLLYGARTSTKDVDAVAGDAAVFRAADRVGARLGFPDGWLNDAAKGYAHGLAIGEPVFSSPSLTVRALAPKQLLAMKLSAWRDDIDIDDARLLLSNLAGSHDQVWAMLEPYLVPGRELKARYAFADLWEAKHGSP